MSGDAKGLSPRDYLYVPIAVTGWGLSESPGKRRGRFPHPFWYRSQIRSIATSFHHGDGRFDDIAGQSIPYYGRRRSNGKAEVIP
jgi:hypothetical protein